MKVLDTTPFPHVDLVQMRKEGLAAFVETLGSWREAGIAINLQHKIIWHSNE